MKTEQSPMPNMPYHANQPNGLVIGYAKIVRTHQIDWNHLLPKSFNLAIKTDIMMIKEKFHKLIDQIEDERTLEAYLNLILKLNIHKNGKLFSNLTIEQKEELEISYHESFVETNLLSNEHVKSQYRRWL